MQQVMGMAVPRPSGKEEVIESSTMPAIRGEGKEKGDYTYICGTCGATLVENVKKGVVKSGTTILCNGCSRYNRFV